MEAFTFVVLTYNQERYIIAHLESIRYQIERWSEGRKIHFILSDDASVDRTARLARAWLREYKNIFASVRVMISRKNRGIVQNYLRALHNVQTEFFKILAGDDLYYKHSVFSAAQTGAFVFSPVLYFCGGRVLRRSYVLRHWVFQEFIHHEGRGLKRCVLRRQRYNNCIYTPGVFFQKKLADTQVDHLLQRYRWMEDYPLWNHLLRRADVAPQIFRQPVVLYRTGSGISTCPNHEQRIRYQMEYLSFLREIGSPFAKYPLSINPYRYLYYARYFLKGAVYFTLVRHLDTRIDSFLRTMEAEEAQAEEYLKEIYQRASRWKGEGTERYNQEI